MTTDIVLHDEHNREVLLLLDDCRVIERFGRRGQVQHEKASTWETPLAAERGQLRRVLKLRRHGYTVTSGEGVDLFPAIRHFGRPYAGGVEQMPAAIEAAVVAMAAPADLELTGLPPLRTRAGEQVAPRAIDRVTRVLLGTAVGTDTPALRAVKRWLDPEDLARWAWTLHEVVRGDLTIVATALAHVGDDLGACRLADHVRTSAVGESARLEALGAMEAVTASAWLDDLVGRCRRRGNRALAARHLRARKKVPPAAYNGLLASLDPLMLQGKSKHLEVVEGLSEVRAKALERAMVSGSSWTPHTFEKWLSDGVFAANARRIVWLDRTRGANVGFRLDENLQPCRSDDSPYVPSGRVEVAHPVALDDLQDWIRVFDDYELLQPFAQLSRFVGDVPAGDGRELEVDVRTPLHVLLDLVYEGWQFDFDTGRRFMMTLPLISRVRVYMALEGRVNLQRLQSTVRVVHLRAGPARTTTGPTLRQLPLRVRSELARAAHVIRVASEV